jgi:hypothetical protein
MLALLGLSTQLLVIALWLALKAWTGFDLANFWVNLVIPIGALGMGFVAGIGFCFARHIDAPAGGAMLLTMIGFSTAGAFFMQYASYWIADTNGVPLRDLSSFADYLRMTNANAAIRMGSHESASVLEVGRMGYVLTLGEMASYVSASLWPLSALSAAPYCRDCARYLRDLENRRLPFPTLDAFKDYAAQLPQSGHARLGIHRASCPPVTPLSQHQGLTTLVATLRACPGCHDHQLTERVSYIGAEGPGSIDAFSRDFSWSGVPQQSPVASPVPSAPQPRGFGRRGLS